MAQGRDDAALVWAIIDLAGSRWLEVIAEGLETPDHADLLIREGCGEAQGCFFGKPLAQRALESRSAVDATPS